jgi:DNA primase
VIAPETIALVRERTDIVAIIRDSVPSLKRRGKSFVGLCPFHQEKSPSFHVNPDRGFFHCFGCKESGSAIDFVMKEQGMTFPEAIRMLAETAGIVIEEERRDRTEVDLAKKRKDELYSVTQLAAVFFEKMLREHPQRKYALDELARRGVAPSDFAARGEQELIHATEEGTTFKDIDDALQAFRIGYAPPNWDGLANFLRAQGVSPNAAEQVGLLVPRSTSAGHYDRFRHRLMFAVVDTHGRVVAFSGRALESIPETENPNRPKNQADGDQKIAKYINSPESPIYTKGEHLFGLYQARHAIRESDQAILVEGNFDVFTLHARGLKNVVAPLGTAFTPEQAKLLKRFTSHVVMAFDGDGAGRKATKLSRAALRDAGLASKVANLPEGSDPDEIARTKGVGELRELVKRARGMLEYLIDVALDANFGSADVYEKAARVSEVSKLIADEDDPLTRMMAKTYADELAARIDLKTIDRVGRHVADAPFAALEQSIKGALAKAGPPAPKLKSGETSAGPRAARIEGKNPERRHRAVIIGALIEYPELLDDAEVEATFPLLEGDSARTLAVLVDSWRTAGHDAETEAHIDPSTLLERLAQIAPAIQTFAAERLSSPQHETAAQAKAELMNAASRLKNVALSDDARAAADQQRRGNADFDEELAVANDLRARLREERHRLPTEARSTPENGQARTTPKKH